MRTPATQLAAQMIGRALDNAVRPDVQQIADATALTITEVGDLVDQVRTDRARTRRVKPVLDPIDANLEHPNPAVRRAARRAKTARSALGAARAELRQALEAAQATAERDKQLAALRKQIAAIEGRQQCPGCGAWIQANRMNAHHTRKHRAAG